MNKQHFTSAISQVFGKFASKEHSKTVQSIINNGYVKLMRLNMSEFSPAESYPTLNALFTRKFITMRPFSLKQSDVISPCDSLITECGKINRDLALQIKGMRYSTDDLLGSFINEDSKRQIHNGTFVNFYLSPRDYHRYHAPMDMQIIQAVHLPGKLYPVNIPTLQKKVNLFVENERVILECVNKDYKRFFMILVGALNVGKMDVSFEPRINTNTTLKPASYHYQNLHLSKGDDFGCFQMGSTIVMLCEEGMIDFNLQPNQVVKCAQNIGSLIEKNMDESI